jgi:hypothetical protein
MVENGGVSVEKMTETKKKRKQKEDDVRATSLGK